MGLRGIGGGPSCSFFVHLSRSQRAKRTNNEARRAPAGGHDSAVEHHHLYGDVDGGADLATGQCGLRADMWRLCLPRYADRPFAVPDGGRSVRPRGQLTGPPLAVRVTSTLPRVAFEYGHT
jgi:hypothetical protein